MIALDRPMPKSCEECPCFHDAACYAEGFRNPTTLDWFERQEKRMPDCPLIDLPTYEDDLW
ncbi:MAG: hypothetical protein IKG55_07950 [Solobacterium sp.]|nr:hypothetical protein [Solobacterium sp.]